MNSQKSFLNKNLADEIVSKYGTPLYVYNQETVKARYQDLLSAFSYKDTAIHYAIKANDNRAILKILKNMGCGVETVSQGEIIKALKAGFGHGDITYTSTSISESELKFVAQNNIFIILDSISQIRKYVKLKPHSKVGLRINLGLGAGHHSHVITGGSESKFGIEAKDITRAIRLASKSGLKITGIHQHIGSNVLDTEIITQAAKLLLATAKNFPHLEFVNFGGGFGVPYRPQEKLLDLKAVGKNLSSQLLSFNKIYGKELKLIIEPGRFLVAESGILLVRVTEIKRNSKHTFVGVDSGLNHLIRPAMYEAYHPIINLSSEKKTKQRIWVVGNICESGDVFGRDRLLPVCHEGDILAILNVGAYGYVMGSNYNSRPKPAEVLINKSRVVIIQKRQKLPYSSQ